MEIICERKFKAINCESFKYKKKCTSWLIFPLHYISYLKNNDSISSKCIGVQSKVISQEIQSGIVFVQSEGNYASLYEFRVHDKRRSEDTFFY